MKKPAKRRGALLLFLLLSCSVWLDLPVRGELSADLGIPGLEQALPPDASEVLGPLQVTDMDAQSVLARMLDYARERLSGMVSEVLRPVAGILAVAVLCAAGESLKPGKEGLDYVNLAGCLSVGLICVSDVQSLAGVGRETMATLSEFAKALLPVLASTAAAAGAVHASAARYTAAALFLDILMEAANTLVFPLICAFLAAGLADAAVGGGSLAGAARVLKWASRFVLTALVTVFTFFLGISGLAASGADALATKAAKTLISAALPVVGGIVSDAAESLVAGAGMLRGAVGVFGMLAVLAVALIPFLRLGLRYVLFKLAAALASVAGGGRLGGLIDCVGAAYGMILALVGTEAVFLYLAILSMVRAVGG